MDTIEGNKLIAVFDGMQIGNLSGWLSGDIGERAYRKVDDIVKEVYSFSRLRYHTSLDWLRPVFDKWLELPNFSDSSLQAIQNNFTSRIAQKIAYESCESAAKQMAIAIQWYNQQKVL